MIIKSSKKAPIIIHCQYANPSNATGAPPAPKTSTDCTTKFSSNDEVLINPKESFISGTALESIKASFAFENRFIIIEPTLTIAKDINAGIRDFNMSENFCFFEGTIIINFSATL